MFGSIGPAEIVLIFVIALLVFGPRKLPEIGKSVGKALREFKKASDEIKGRIEEEIDASSLKEVKNDLKSGLQDIRSGMSSLQSGVTDIKEGLKEDIQKEAPKEDPKKEIPTNEPAESEKKP